MAPRIFSESRASLKRDIAQYLKATKRERWEIMRLVPSLLEQYEITDLTTDLQILREVYGEALGEHATRLNCSEPLATEEYLDRLIMSVPVRKLFLRAWNESLADERSLQQIAESLAKRPRANTTEENHVPGADRQGEPDVAGSKPPTATKPPARNRGTSRSESVPETLTTLELVDLLAKNSPTLTFKDESFKILDLSSFKNAKGTLAAMTRELRMRLKTRLELASTIQERQWLLKFSKCKNQKDIDELLKDLFACESCTPTISYIRTAINCLSVLWQSRTLEDSNNEGWFQSNLYSQIFDAVFMQQSHWMTKRSETLSMTLRTARLSGIDVADRKIDFILKSKDDDVDIMAVEDKPKPSKKVDQDLEKTSLIQQITLLLWRDRIGAKRVDLMAELEAITCQWTGPVLEIFGTRLVGSTFIYYRRARIQVPTHRRCAQAALVLLTIISLKRSLLLNYGKLGLMMKARDVQQITTLTLLGSDPDYDVAYFEADEKGCLRDVRRLRFESSILTNQDWEQITRLINTEEKKEQAAQNISNRQEEQEEQDEEEPDDYAELEGVDEL
ncbi:hypothetical protein BGZ59_004831 [Podila verticillata]|nr:hypothetical protein BGZ59_004831 [Podila verticillata]